MPRGVRTAVDYTEQLEQLGKKIDKHREALAALEKQRRDLLKRKRDSDLQKLCAFMEKNELTAETVIACVTRQTETEA